MEPTGLSRSPAEAVVLILVAAGVGVILVALMTGIYRYGDRVIPDGAQVPVHSGLGGWDNWQPKRRGLLTWPILGAALSALLVAVVAIVQQAGHAGGHHGGAAAAWITMAAWAVLGIVLPLSQYRAIRAALDRARKS
jgi:hypothetical protein